MESGEVPLVVAEDSQEGMKVETALVSLTVEQATERLGPKVLKALEERFNGSLVQVRALDEKDLLF